MAQRERIGDRLEHAIERHAELPPEELARAETEAESRRPSLRRTAIWLAITGVSLYLVAPSLLDVLGSWRDVTRLELIWLPVMLVAQTASLACLWDLQRIALHRPPWGPVIASQLAGNALAKIAPGGGAIGATLQYRMLVESGVRRADAVSGVTAVNLLLVGVVLALPVLALPAIVRGSVTRSLVETALVAIAVFAALAGLATAALAFDAPLARIGKVVQRVRNRLRRGSEPVTMLPARLLRERDRILLAFGPRWHRAVLMAVGRW
ncbi:MAG TPA: UPF0104 family protein, partial [Solirubrobacteraceae bacterium]|nr:UPF0104 family protein [Solirubrobacteraceae bacterium]